MDTRRSFSLPQGPQAFLDSNNILGSQSSFEKLPVSKIESSELSKVDLNLAEGLVQTDDIRKLQSFLCNTTSSLDSRAKVLAQYLESLYNKCSGGFQHPPSLYSLQGKRIYCVYESSRKPEGEHIHAEGVEWFLTNAYYIREYIKENLKCPIQGLKFLQTMWSNLSTLLKANLIPHLDVIFASLQSKLGSLDGEKTLSFFLELEALVNNLYSEPETAFEALRDFFRGASLQVDRILLYYLKNIKSTKEYPVASLFKLVANIEMVNGKNLSSQFLQPIVEIITLLEEQQEQLLQNGLSPLYERVYSAYLEVYFSNKSYILKDDTDTKRFVAFMFLRQAKGASAAPCTMEELKKRSTLKAVNTIKDLKERAKVLGIFLNQLFALDKLLSTEYGRSRTSQSTREKGVQYLVDVYFRGVLKNEPTVDSFFRLSNIIFNYLKPYLVDLQKDTQLSSFSILGFIEEIIGSLNMDTRIQIEKDRSLSYYVKEITEPLVKRFFSSGESAQEAWSFTLKLYNLLAPLDSERQEDIRFFGYCMIDCMPKEVSLSDILSNATQVANITQAQEASLFLSLVQCIYKSLNQKVCTEVVEFLENQEPFFAELGLTEAYRETYGHALEAYFFHKMTYSERLFPDMDKDKARLNKVFHRLFPAFIQHGMGKERIFADIPFASQDFELAKEPPLKNIRCFVNMEGYFELNDDFKGQLPSAPLEGKAIQLSANDATPIGYTIYVPESPKAIWVHAYGGTQSQEKVKAYRHNFLGLLHKNLLDKDIAVMHLNLPDILELEVFQSDIPRDLYLKIQACIHRFYELIHKEPESLHPDLAHLKDLPICLYGGSFGGGLSINQGILYPKSFDGYISHCGLLDNNVRFMSINKPGTVEDRFNPRDSLDKIQDRLLILHNLTDHIVNSQNAYTFFKKAYKHKKNVRLHLTAQGGRNVREGSDRFCYIGHFYPVLKRSLEAYVGEIVSFLTKRASSLSMLSRLIGHWRVHEYASYMDKYTHGRTNAKAKNLGSIEKLFLSEAYRVYKNARGLVDRSGKRIQEKQEPAFMDTADKIDTTWETHYLPLYKAYICAEGLEKDHRLLDQFLNDKSTESSLHTSIETFFKKLLPYLSESLSMPVEPSESALEAIIYTMGPVLIESLRGNSPSEIKNQWPSTDSIDHLHKPFLRTLFAKHPALVEQYLSSTQKSEIEKDSPALKAQFLKLIHKSKQRGARVMREGLLGLRREWRLKSLVQDYRKQSEKA